MIAIDTERMAIGIKLGSIELIMKLLIDLQIIDIQIKIENKTW